MKIDFYKYHALGNDYIVIDPNKVDFDVTIENIKLVCDRHFGIGSDGILLGPILDEGIKLRIFNPDGSEAEKSGNGIRIFAKYLMDAGYVKSNFFSIATMGGIVIIEVLDDHANLIKVDMGMANFASTAIPVCGQPREVINEELLVGNKIFLINSVSVGNPHCVILTEDLSRDNVLKIGPLIENHPIFPQRVNVQFLKVLDRKNIQIEIWERGAGYTMASGSSSCAAASVANRLGLVDSEVEVHMPGGVLAIEIKTDQHIFMTGSVYGVMRGSFDNDFYAALC
jgi:diaminopimelate epimerase